MQSSPALPISSHTLAFGEMIRCPVCGGQSISQSLAPEAQEILAFIETHFNQGYSEDQIREILVVQFGEQVNFCPSATHWVLWGFPVGLVLLFLFLGKRWIKWQKM